MAKELSSKPGAEAIPARGESVGPKTHSLVALARRDRSRAALPSSVAALPSRAADAPAASAGWT
jgi:hypothetical protein